MKFSCIFFVIFCFSSCMTQKKNIQVSDDHHKLAISLLQKCDSPRALSHLLRAVQFNPKDFIIRNTLAATYYSMKEYEKAILEYKNILKIKPNLTEARVSLARIYIELDQLDQAFKQIKQAEKDMTYTGRLKLLTYKALANYKKRKYIQAKKYFDEALSLPQGRTCFNYIHFGKTELALRSFTSAEKLLKKAVLQCQKEKPVCEEPQFDEYLALAQLYIKKKNKKRAEYYLNIFLKKTKDKEKAQKVKELFKSSF